MRIKRALRAAILGGNETWTASRSSKEAGCRRIRDVKEEGSCHAVHD